MAPPPPSKPAAARAGKKGAKTTPMMEQYREARSGLPPKTLLFFRLGDFYEMFEGDAEAAAPVLGITLTNRQGRPMAGVPYHAADGYIAKALAAGWKVAICEQVETPVPGKIVKRRLTRILTPGTTLEDHQVEAGRNHFLLALEFGARDGALHAAWLDLTTGEFQLATDARPENLLPVLTAIDAREIVVPELAGRAWAGPPPGDPGGGEGPAEGDTDPLAAAARARFQELSGGRTVSTLPDYHFDADPGAQAVIDALGVLNLEGFGIRRDHPALGAAGALVHYATETLCARPENLRRIAEYRSGGALLLDPATLRNLEVFRAAGNSREGSLLAAMDATVTAAGARALESFLAGPPLDLGELGRRQRCVGEFLGAPGLASELREYLKGVRDLPRILGRLQNRLRNPRELGGVRDTLQRLPAILQVLEHFGGEAAEDGETGGPGGDVAALAARVGEFPGLRATLEGGLMDDLPGQLQDGGYIRDGHDVELDRLRALSADNKGWLAELERSEAARTKIKNLRVKYNGAFGYFIEVTKANLHLVPEDYVRRQTMTNAERFTTEDLKSKEKEILHAEEKSLAREAELFRQLVAAVLARADDLRATADALAQIDVFLGWAQLAREWGYCRPGLDDSDTIQIEGGRHPVVEQMMRRERHGLAGAHAFVPNHTDLSCGGTQIALITGPNMAGKSTYIRQVALLVLMAQVGSWVPADHCRVGLVDRIFSRVGASDELARGNSTFMVEMNETANIINNTTGRSLIILDEIGRGTSTYDGLSIAWAVVEHLHGAGEAGPRTLFATHYHELTLLARRLGRVRNFQVAVKEWNEQIIFVRQVVAGAADRSYGIQVARLAGLPRSVISRAQEILDQLEADDSSHNLIRRHLKKSKRAEQSGQDAGQLSLF